MTRFNNESSSTCIAASSSSSPSNSCSSSPSSPSTATINATTSSAAETTTEATAETVESNVVEADKPEVKFIGQPCGHHGPYTFYKAFSYKRRPNDLNRVLMLGEFFFVRISPNDDPCIGELQLLWHDHHRHQMLSSTRLYFLPEQTPEGRLSHHGQHEVMAAQDKVILKLTDLVGWITHKVDWIAGMPYKWQPQSLRKHQHDDEKENKNSSDNDDGDDQTTTDEQHRQQKQVLSSLAFIHNQNVIPRKGSGPFLTSQRYINDRCKIRFNHNQQQNNHNLNDSMTTIQSGDDDHFQTNNNDDDNKNQDPITKQQRQQPLGYTRRSFACSRVDFSDIIPQKLRSNELQDDLSTVVVLSYTRYCRYRNLLKRIEGKEDEMLTKGIVQDALTELGIPQQRNSRVNILFCRDTFNHDGLLNNDLNCEHLAPKLKGRPRKRPLKLKTSSTATNSNATVTIRASSPESISSEENGRLLFSPRRTRRTTAASTLASSNRLNQTNQQNSSLSAIDNRKTSKKNKTSTLTKNKNLKRSNNIKNNHENRTEFELKNKNNKKFDKENNKPGSIVNNNDGGDKSNSHSIDANNNIDDKGNVNISAPTTASDHGNNRKNMAYITNNNKEVFFKELNEFMNKRKTPIQRVPNLGFKKIDLHLFFTRAQRYGGYEQITKKRLWKRLYDDMGGDKRSTSAATCTRRHYEKLLLPFERLLNGFNPDDMSICKSRRRILNSNSNDNNKSNRNNNNNQMATNGSENGTKSEEDSDDIDAMDEDESESVSNFSESDSKDNDNNNNNDSDDRLFKSKENEDGKKNKLTSVQQTNHTKSLDDDHHPMIDTNQQDDDEQVILKRSQTKTPTTTTAIIAKYMKIVETSEQEVSILKEQNNNDHKNIDKETATTSEENIELIPREHDFISNKLIETNLFRDIAANSEFVDNENIRINNLSNSKLPIDDDDEQTNHKKIKLNNQQDEDKCLVNKTTNHEVSQRQSINHTTLAKNEPLNPSTVLFSKSNSHNKMTALVHPTQRMNEDVYDFRDFNSNENDDREILMLKSFSKQQQINFRIDDGNNKIQKANKTSNQTGQQSPNDHPLHSISNLVNNVSDKQPTEKPQLNNQEPMMSDNRMFQNSPSKIIIPTNIANLHNDIFNAFSLPKPLENPKKILMSFKSDNGRELNNDKKPIEPMPAHRNSGHNLLGATNKDKIKFNSNNEQNSDEILDLSLKKRCYEADSRTSPTRSVEQNSVGAVKPDGILLDLSTKHKPVFNVNHPKSAYNKHLTMSNAPTYAADNHSTVYPIHSAELPQIQKDQHINQQLLPSNNQFNKQHHSKPKISTNQHFQRPQAQMPSQLQKSNSSSSIHKNHHIPDKRSLHKMTSKSPLSKSPTLKTVTGQFSSPSLSFDKMNSIKPSISDYNPKLPTFIGSHSHYWPSTISPSAAASFSYFNSMLGSSASSPTPPITNIAGLTQQFLSSAANISQQQQSGSPSSFNPSLITNNTNPLLHFVGQNQSDRFKLCLETYAAMAAASAVSIPLKSFEQNPLLLNNMAAASSGQELMMANLAANYSNQFHHLFTSSSSSSSLSK